MKQNSRPLLSLIIYISILTVLTGTIRINYLFPTIVLNLNDQYWIVMLSVNLLNLISIIFWAWTFDQNLFRRKYREFSILFFSLFLISHLLTFFLPDSSLYLQYAIFFLSLFLGKFIVIFPLFYIGFFEDYDRYIRNEIPILIALGFLGLSLFFVIFYFFPLSVNTILIISSLGIVCSIIFLVFSKNIEITQIYYVNQPKYKILRKNKNLTYPMICLSLLFLTLSIIVTSSTGYNSALNEKLKSLIIYFGAGCGCLIFTYWSKKHQKFSITSIYSSKIVILCICLIAFPLIFKNLFYDVFQKIFILVIINNFLTGISSGIAIIFWLNIWNIYSSQKERGYYLGMGMIAFFLTSPSGIVYGIFYQSYLNFTNWVPILLLIIILLVFLRYDKEVFNKNYVLMKEQESEPLSSMRIEIQNLYEQEQFIEEYEKLLFTLRSQSQRGKPPKWEYSALIILLLEKSNYLQIEINKIDVMKSAIMYILKDLVSEPWKLDTIRKNTKNHIIKLEKQKVVEIKDNHLYLNLDWQSVMN